MKKQQKVLNKHVDLKLYTNQHKKLEFWIIQAMNEYAELYHKSKVKNLSLSGVIKSVCDLPKSEQCHIKLKKVCAKCKGCEHLEQTVL